MAFGTFESKSTTGESWLDDLTVFMNSHEEVIRQSDEYEPIHIIIGEL